MTRSVDESLQYLDMCLIIIFTESLWECNPLGFYLQRFFIICFISDLWNDRKRNQNLYNMTSFLNAEFPPCFNMRNMAEAEIMIFETLRVVEHSPSPLFIRHSTPFSAIASPWVLSFILSPYWISQDPAHKISKPLSSAFSIPKAWLPAQSHLNFTIWTSSVDKLSIFQLSLLITTSVSSLKISFVPSDPST